MSKEATSYDRSEVMTPGFKWDEDMDLANDMEEAKDMGLR